MYPGRRSAGGGWRCWWSSSWSHPDAHERRIATWPPHATLRDVTNEHVSYEREDQGIFDQATLSHDRRRRCALQNSVQDRQVE
ncbi:uncharacterized protein N7500_001841 [Penicillium coprophilum]|uniref:uncharacterized protein n=1 Tax=Penicillium coprophilum TaxID=36646 RepID=UPI00239F8DFB|nr:uncharacterized protein N7500_001841 [Penicillium coprophilum]KAJ5173910.1 hypothetical protein N7500_001841 [Penicillium coprophilum]